MEGVRGVGWVTAEMRNRKAANLCTVQPQTKTKALMNTHSQGNNEQWNACFLMYVSLVTYKITFEGLEIRLCSQKYLLLFHRT